MKRALGGIFVAVALCAGSAVRAVAGEPDPTLLTTREIEFLSKHTPEISRVVSSGAIVAYGHIIEPPILISVERGRIHLDALRVSPREARSDHFLARKRVGEMEDQFFLARGAGRGDAMEQAQQHALVMAKSGRSTGCRIHIENGRTKVRVVVDGQEWFGFLEGCPGSVFARFNFIIRLLSRSYLQRKESSGKDAAWAWLQDRFSDLKGMGILSSYRLAPEDESIWVTFSCADHEVGHGFYRTPRGVADENAAKSTEMETRRKASNVVQMLESGKLLVYSHDFEKHAPLKPAVLKALKDFHKGGGGKEAEALVRDALGLTPPQMGRFLEEIR